MGIVYETYRLTEAGWCPNNPACPLLLYRSVNQNEPESLARWFEKTFAEHGWPPAWRYTIYDFPHYHSNTHEVIGVYQGWAEVRMGGTNGVIVKLQAGDAVVIPAGVSHQRLDGSDDFSAVGAYPKGFEPDQMRGVYGERPAADQRIQRIPRPNLDPVAGVGGPLRQEWPETVAS